MQSTSACGPTLRSPLLMRITSPSSSDRTPSPSPSSLIDMDDPDTRLLSQADDGDNPAPDPGIKEGNDTSADRPAIKEKKNKRGIIYLSYIPDGMTPRNVRPLLSRFGEIDRIYFEPARLRNGVAISFREGWIEFLKKRVAKQVATLLNGSIITSRKKFAFCGSVWAMKYLHRVKWQHLSEQVNLEKVGKDQRLRMEMGRVKKESDFFADQMDHLKKRKKKGTQAPDDVLEKRKRFYDKMQNKEGESGPVASAVDEELLHSIFS